MAQQQQGGPKKPFRETAAKQPPAAKKRTTPVDTTALKNAMNKDYESGMTDIGIAARSKRGSNDESNFTSSANRKMVSYSRGKATLDSARAGQIPAKKEKASPIRQAMMPRRTSAVDRIEGSKAVLEDDAGGTRTVPRDSLKNPAEGRVYHEGVAEPDTAEERRRRAKRPPVAAAAPAKGNFALDVMGKHVPRDPKRQYDADGRVKARSFSEGMSAIKAAMTTRRGK